MKESFIYREKGKDKMYKIWHSQKDAMMFLYCHSDGGSIVTHEKVYPIQSGTLCFIGANKMHYTLPDPPESYVRSKIFIPNERFYALTSLCGEEFLNLFTINSLLYAKLPTKNLMEVEALFDKLSLAPTKALEPSLLSTVLNLMGLIAEHSFNTCVKTENFDPVARAITFINDNIKQNLTVEEICNAVHLSKYYFCRKFKSVTSLTVMNYILLTRLTLAKELLADKTISVSEVSERCGFSSISYFCNVFKRENDISPSAYRKKQI